MGIYFTLRIGALALCRCAILTKFSGFVQGNSMADACFKFDGIR